MCVISIDIITNVLRYPNWDAAHQSGKGISKLSETHHCTESQLEEKQIKYFLFFPRKEILSKFVWWEWKKISIQKKKFSVFCQRNEMEEQELHLSINIFSVRRTNFLSGSFTQQQFDHSWYSEILSATFQWGWRLISSLRGIILHVRQRSVENVMEQKKIVTFKPGSFAQE